MTGGRGALARLVTLLLAGLIFAGLLGLGVWQLQRLAWKTDLIARTEALLAAPPVAPPLTADFAAMAQPEYLRLRLEGAYLALPPTLVQALTQQGRGYWVMTPFRSDSGDIILINRGFLPEAARNAVPPAPAGPQQLTGLLRLSQPGGAFLRRNDPDSGRWFSRDIAAIGESLGLAPVPWFLDLGTPGAAVAPGVLPVPGLTVVRFRNSHLGYALTWFALAAIWACGAVTLISQRRA